jgi:hypothetical protein
MPTEVRRVVATSGPRFGTDEYRRSVTLFAIVQARSEHTAHP